MRRGVYCNRCGVGWDGEGWGGEGWRGVGWEGEGWGGEGWGGRDAVVLSELVELYGLA